MLDIPMPGTWVRLTKAGVPSGSWHLVVGWHPDAGRLQLRCINRDRNISWALDGPGPWTVARSSQPPEEEACRTCRFRETHPGQGHRRTPVATAHRTTEVSPRVPRLRRVGRSAWAYMTSGTSSASRGR